MVVGECKLYVIVQIGCEDCQATEPLCFVKAHILQILSSCYLHLMDSFQIVQNVYLPQVDLGLHYSQLGHFQKGSIDDSHHPRVIWIIHHKNLSISIIHGGIVHSLPQVRSQQKGMSAFLVSVDIYLSFGYILEGNEHLSLGCFQFGSIADLEIVEDVIVHVAFGVGGGSLFRAVHDDPVLYWK